jgi:hypothetical protein
LAVFKLTSGLVALVILAVVLCLLLNEGRRSALCSDTLGGLLVGLVHGLLHVYCKIEVTNNVRPLTPRRIIRIALLDLRVDMVVGLLIGVVKVVFAMCAA